MPTTDRYRRALEAAVREYERLGQARAEIDKRLAQLAQTIGSLSRLCNLTPTVPYGLTEACRLVLKAAGHPLTATEVRAQLDAMGFDLERYSNDLASIHTVLKRLNASGEAQFVARAWGKPAYAWSRPARVVALTGDVAKAIFGDEHGPDAPGAKRGKRS